MVGRADCEPAPCRIIGYMMAGACHKRGLIGTIVDTCSVLGWTRVGRNIFPLSTETGNFRLTEPD